MFARRVVDLAGTTIAYGADTSLGEEILHSFFGPLADSDGRVRFEINLRQSPVREADAVPRVGAGPVSRRRSGAVLLASHDLGAAARVTDTALEVVHPASIKEPRRAVRHLLFNGLSWWYERSEVLLLHGAMIARGDLAALVLGDTGSGKSTAALAALSDGWKIGSDDLVLARAAGDGVELFGIPKRPTVDAVVARQLRLELQPLPDDSRRRFMLPAGVVSLGWRRLQLLVTVGHDQGVGDLHRLGHEDALDAVLAAYLESEDPDAVRRQLAALARLAAVPAYQLLHAADGDSRLTTSARLLSEAWLASTGPSDQN